MLCCFDALSRSFLLALFEIRLLDRMENKGGAAGSNGGVDDALMHTAQLKAQKAAAERCE